MFSVPSVAVLKFCRQGRPQQGSAVVELTLLLPWFLFLFVGTIDMGFYGYALISLQSAARVAALYSSTTSTTSTDSATACFYAVEEMKSNINMSGVTTCGGTSPISVATSQISTVDGSPAAQVVVTYTTPQLFAFPGAISGQFTISRVVQMRIRG